MEQYNAYIGYRVALDYTEKIMSNPIETKEIVQDPQVDLHTSLRTMAKLFAAPKEGAIKEELEVLAKKTEALASNTGQTDIAELAKDIRFALHDEYYGDDNDPTNILGQFKQVLFKHIEQPKPAKVEKLAGALAAHSFMSHKPESVRLPEAEQVSQPSTVPKFEN